MDRRMNRVKSNRVGSGLNRSGQVGGSGRVGSSRVWSGRSGRIWSGHGSELSFSRHAMVLIFKCCYLTF